MRTRHSISKKLIFIVLLLAATLVVASFVLPNPAKADHTKAVRDSWLLMQQVGRYEFSTTVEQTAYPAPKLANVGRSSTKDVYHVSGEADMPNHSMLVSLWQNQGSLLSQSDSIDIRLEDGKAWGRLSGADWQEIDTFSADTFAPGQDASAFLVAANNVHAQEPVNLSLPVLDGGQVQVNARPYTFDLDPQRFAAYMRDQMVRELQRSGKLPFGMHLGLSEEYLRMTASGQVWIDPDGLPLRMTLHMQFPPEKSGERVDAYITTDFYNHDRQNLQQANALPGRMLSGLGLPSTLQDLWELALPLQLSASFILLMLLLVVYSRKRVVYALAVVLVIFSMLFSPLWEGAQASEFYDEMRAKQQQQQAQVESAKDERQAVQDIYGMNWDPHAAPLTAADTAAQAATDDQASSTVGTDGADMYQPQAWRVAPAVPASVLQQAGEAGAAADSDEDGLTDEYEAQFCPNMWGECILDPALADTDSDGLSDGEEQRMGTLPGQADSDGDLIWDKDEVEGFRFSGEDWYSDPMSRDTDKDGNLDSLECPDRKMPVPPTPGWTPGPCTTDTDNDGTPDIFDPDDDGDGAPSTVDASDYAYSTEVYSVTRPLEVSAAGLTTTVKTIFMNYQLRPVVEEHLTYAMNVLDWPTNDLDGQVQRVSDATFAASMSAGQREKDPKAGNGDMRLMPMIEVKLTGSMLPLPLTSTLRVPITDTLRIAATITGAFTLSGAAGATQVKWVQGPAGTYPVYHGTGDCDYDFQLDSTSLGSLAVGDPGVNTSIPLGEFADGGHILAIKSGDGSLLACANVRGAAHGSLVNQIVDQSLLRNYGVQARQEMDESVIVYAPLALVYDYVGGMPVSFQSKIPFTNANGGFDSSSQEVRIVWLLNVLTDVCKTPYPEGQTFDTYCTTADLSHWNTNISRIVHSYSDQFTLVGLSVEEDHGVDMAVAFEDPAVDSDFTYDDPLWGLSRGLDGSFLAGRDQNSDGARDVTVANIETRFDPDQNGCPAPVPANSYSIRDPLIYPQDWGIPCNAFQVWRGQYDSADAINDFMSNQVQAEIFDVYFTSPHLPVGVNPPDYANLLFTREVSSRSLAVGEPGVAHTGNTWAFDFSGQPIFTTAILNWAPYQRDGSQWESYPLQDYLDVLEANLRVLDAYHPANESQEARYIADGQIYLASYYYQGLYRGVATLVSFNGTPQSNPVEIVTDIDITGEFSDKAGAADMMKSAVESLVEMLGPAFNRNIEIAELMLTMSGETLSVVDKTKIFFRSVGESVSEQKGVWGKVFTGLKIAFWIAVAVVALAQVAILIVSLAAPDSEAARLGVRIVSICVGLASAVIAAVALPSAVAAYKAGEAIAGATAKAAVIGLVIGILVVWGLFIGMWAGSGESFGSLAVNNMLADALATTATLVIFTILALNPIGAIVVLVIAIIDGLIMLVCAASGANDLGADHWSQKYVCMGISGWVTKIIKWFIYGMEYMVDYDNGDRLAFTGLDQEIEDEWLGMAVGNQISVTVGVSNTITRNGLPLDWKAILYAWQWTDNGARSTHFTYNISPGDGDEYDLHGGLERFNTSAWDADQGSDRNHGWTDLGDHKFNQAFTARTSGYTIVMPEPGLNRTPIVFFNEGSAVPVQECWTFPIIWWPYLFPVCYVRTEKNTSHSSLGTSMTVDVFPATLDDFYELTSIEDGGVTLAWGQGVITDDLSAENTSPLNFPVFKDADGDGLISLAQGGDDPDDSLYDTDGDRLSDFTELAEGLNSRLFDTDGDGLWDAEEVHYGSDPRRKDSDGDGLPDDQEKAGWLYTYAFDPDGTPKETMVYPDPLQPDTDFDGLTDLLEKIYGFNPNVSQDPSVLRYGLDTRELDAPLVLLRFDEDRGAAVFADSSNFGFSASCKDDACPLSSLDGRYAKAIRLDGSQDYLALTSSARAISLWNDQPFTLGAWVKWNGGAGTILSKWNEAPNYKQEMRFEVNADGTLKLTNSSSTAVVSSSGISAGSWQHVAAAFDGSQVSFYVDGDAAGGGGWSTPTTSAISDTQVTVGAYLGASSAAGFFNGDLDEVALFDRALAQSEIQDNNDAYPHLMPARYNLNDSFVRPGEQIFYQSTVENLLNSRFAYGLLTTLFNPRDVIVDWLTKLLPVTFKLWPKNPAVSGVGTAVISDTLQIDPASPSGNLAVEQTVTAQIVDERSESNFAEIWLKMDEASGAQFGDSSGSMPPRYGDCAANCPTHITDGILNGAAEFASGVDTPIRLYRKLSMTTNEALTLGEMELVDRDYTLALWVRPPASAAAGTTLTLLDSTGDNLSLSIKKSSLGDYFLPEVKVNGAVVTLNEADFWRALLPAPAWSHLALRYTRDSQTLDIYVNGARVITKTAVSPIIPGAANAAVWVGGAPQDAAYRVDDVRIFSHPLGDLDINILAERPVLQLKMDSTSFADSSIYGQTISLVNIPHLSPTAVSDYSMQPGQGSGMGYLKTQGNALLDMRDGAFTFSTWIRPEAGGVASSWQGIFGYTTFLTDTLNIGYLYPTLERQGLRLRFGFGDSAVPVKEVTTDVLAADQWNHVVVTFGPRKVDGVTRYEYVLYVNALPVDSYLFSGKPGSASTFFVGHSSHKYRSTVNYLHVTGDGGDAGDVAEVKLWKAKRTGAANQVGGLPFGDDGCIWCSEHDVNGVHDYPVNWWQSLSTTDGQYQDVYYNLMEYDWGANPNDNCGYAYNYWYDLPQVTNWPMSDGVSDGSYLQVTVDRPSTQFFGQIDELEVYRYALDSEQVFDLFNALPVTSRLPLDDRPGTQSFENRAFVGVQDNGTCSGDACPSAGTIGLIDQAVRFDGADDVITVPDVQSTSDYMVSLWLNTLCPDCGIYSLRDAADSILNQIYLKNGNVCTLTGSMEMCTNSGSYADEQWHHVVYSNNGSTANLWLDGSIVNTISGGATLTTGDNAQLGVAADAAQDYLYGQLDDVRIFRYSQSAAMVALLRRRAPLALFHLDELTSVAGMQDATTADWMLACSGEACPQADMEGRLARAVELDGNDRLALSQTQLSAAAGSFSMGVWVMPTRVVSQTQTLWVLGSPGNTAPRYSVATAPDSLSLCVLKAQANDVCNAQSHVQLIQNVWNLVMLTVEQPVNPTASFTETVSLYINGYLDSTLAGNYGAAAALSGLGKLTLGDRPAEYPAMAGGPFGGRIDEVGVYEYLLNEIDVRDTFHYQMAQVEERERLALTIDADDPQASLVSYNPDFIYLAGSDIQLHVQVADTIVDEISPSGVAMVEMLVQRGGNPYASQVAPPCMDASDGAYCPTFDPGSSNGAFSLSFRAVDQVGRQSTSQAYPVIVDPYAPTIFSDQATGDLLPADFHKSARKTWTLHLSGSVFDVEQDDGTPGSGVNLDSMQVTVYSQRGDVVGKGAQAPAITPAALGYDWQINYLIPEQEPSGSLRVVIEAADKVGNRGQREFSILLDGTPPRGTLDAASLPELSLAAAPEASAATPPILISGVLSGTVSDAPGEDAPYLTPEGQAAASGVSRVETAFTPDVDVSFLYNEPYPEGLLAWMPLDGEQYPPDENGDPDPAADTRLFMDISPYQISGVCPVAECPQAGVDGHKMGSVYYDGLGQYINLGQQVDLAQRSFTVSVWAKRDRLGQNDPILWQGPVSLPDRRFLFGLNAENRFVCGFGGADLVTSQAYADTGWHYWACTFDLDSGARSIYRDGLSAASDVAAPIPVTYENLFIGQAPVGDYKGYLDDLVVLDRALDAEQVRQQYVGYNMVFHLAVEENYYAGGDLLADRSGYFHEAMLQSSGDENLGLMGDINNKVDPGRVGQFALTFDGNDKLAVPASYSLDPNRPDGTAPAFTQSAWIKLDAAGSGQRDVISLRDENPEMRYPSLIVTADNRLEVGFGNFYAWNSVQTDPGVVTPDIWSFVAAAFDGETYRVYVDGTQVLTSTALAGLNPYGAERFNIGDGFVGQIDDVRVSMRALRGLEIRALMQSSWHNADIDVVSNASLAPGAGSATQATWTSGLVQGVEGPYHIGARGWDVQGHYDTSALVNNQWGGVVDTLAPRISLVRTPEPAPIGTLVVTYSFSIEDLMLDETSILVNLCAGAVQLEREYFNSPWYLAQGTPPNTSLYRVSGQCRGSVGALAEVSACDTGGNCSTASISPLPSQFVYLPLVTSPLSRATVAAAAPVSRRGVPLAELAIAAAAETEPPLLAISTQNIGPEDMRSMFHINLQGRVSDNSAVAWVKLRILQDGVEVYSTKASVYKDVWNAMWLFLPGHAPQPGVYTLEVTAADLSGNLTTLSQPINLQFVNPDKEGR